MDNMTQYGKKTQTNTESLMLKTGPIRLGSIWTFASIIKVQNMIVSSVIVYVST